MIYGGLVHPQHSTGVLNLPVSFFIESSAILMHTAAVSHLVLLVPVGEGKNENYQSIRGDVFSDTWIYPPNVMNPIGACSPGFSQAASAESNLYSAIISATIELFISA